MTELLTTIGVVIGLISAAGAAVVKHMSYVKTQIDIVVEANKEAYNAMSEKAAIEKDMRIDAQRRLQEKEEEVEQLKQRIAELENASSSNR